MRGFKCLESGLGDGWRSDQCRRVGQSFDSPTVYLDHWAIRLFSDDGTLQDRLVAALSRKRGTLLVSNVSMAELGGASDPRHVMAALPRR
jgi:hypothetical protein